MPNYLSPGVYVEELRGHPGSVEGVRAAAAEGVDDVLSRSTTFAAMEGDRRVRIAGDVTLIATALLTAAPPDEAPGHADLFLDAVDFPAFVADLLARTFGAVVDASIEQMDAYAELLADVASAIEDFAEATPSRREASDLLARALLAGVAVSASCPRR